MDPKALQFCANRVMALQELQALGTMAAGFLDAGCYRCSGRDDACEYYTPLGWVYETAREVPPQIVAFLPGNAGDEGKNGGG